MKGGEGIHPTEKVTVTSEMVGELFDLLGLFPRRISKAETNEFLFSISGKAHDILERTKGFGHGGLVGEIEDLANEIVRITTEYADKLQSDSPTIV